MTEQVQPAPRSQRPTRRILQGLGSLVLIVAIFWFLFKGIAFGQVWAAIRALTWLEVATLAAVYLRPCLDVGHPRAGLLAGDGHDPVHYRGR